MRFAKRYLVGATIAIAIGVSGSSCDLGTPAVSRAFDGAKSNPVALRAFLNDFPKGADLHNHLVGAVYAEQIITLATARGQCFTLANSTITNPPCGAGTRPIRDAAFDRAFNDTVIDALSMRHFVPEQSPRISSGYEQFFATFGRFGAAFDEQNLDGQLTAAKQIAARDNVEYVEYMATPLGQQVAALGQRVGLRRNLATTANILRVTGMRPLTRQISRALRVADTRFNVANRCQSNQPDRACKVKSRFLYQVIRTLPPAQVFAQLVAGFELARTDPRVVGINLVGAENDPIALRDYDLQMAMVKSLNSSGRPIKIALHAGELTEGLVNPTVLGTHIRKAMDAGAERIGHGTDLAYDPNPGQLMADMVTRKTTVEIALTSSEQILGIKGAEHAFASYLGAGVPTVLSTDDQGVSRTDLTAQYQQAVQRYGLTYDQLLAISRQGLESSFLPGSSIWNAGVTSSVVAECAAEIGHAPGDISAACLSYLRGSPRASAQFALEQRLATFGREAPSRYTAAPSSPNSAAPSA